MRLLHILSVSLLLILAKPASANSIPEYEQQLFIESWASLAVEQMRLYGIPASITLAQAIVESGWGTGYVAKKANNYFCIKSNNGWTGPIVKAIDDEIDSSSFRQYTNIEESFHDHAKFLRENRRYQSLFQLDVHDYKGWAFGLKSAGYATKDDYAEYLIATIEKYGLYLFDYAIPADQINSSKLPFEQEEAVVLPPAPKTDFIIQAADSQPAIVNSSANNGNGQAMPAPGYSFNRESLPTRPAEQPAVEMPSPRQTIKIDLILPMSRPSFNRR